MLNDKCGWTQQDQLILVRAGERGGSRSFLTIANMVLDDETDYIKMRDRTIGRANDKHAMRGA